MKDIIGVLELVIIAWFTFKIVRRLLFGKKRRRRSVLKKVGLLVSRQLHSVVDNMLYKQSKRLAKSTQQAHENVIEFKKYSRQRIN
jgi:uncharacterized metal-binding protein